MYNTDPILKKFDSKDVSFAKVRGLFTNLPVKFTHDEAQEAVVL